MWKSDWFWENDLVKCWVNMGQLHIFRGNRCLCSGESDFGLASPVILMPWAIGNGFNTAIPCYSMLFLPEPSGANTAHNIETVGGGLGVTLATPGFDSHIVCMKQHDLTTRRLNVGEVWGLFGRRTGEKNIYPRNKMEAWLQNLFTSATTTNKNGNANSNSSLHLTKQ